MNHSYILGWDIGGAHVKAALLSPDGALVGVYQQPCPLWQGLERLQTAIREILQAPEVIGYQPVHHGVTMTGELVDLFASRDQGVRQIISTFAEMLPGHELNVFAGRQGFIKVDKITPNHYAEVASANWWASSLLAAKHFGSGLFIDIGSTTTDIITFKESEIKAEGFSDYQRLITGELVYTGIIRTPVMAVAQTVVDQNQPVPLMAEYFATMADVYRLTGELNEKHDQCQTADGAEKTIRASAQRLARMIGCDYRDQELERWLKFAEAIRRQQIQQIYLSCLRQSNKCRDAESNCVIGAGVGRFLVKHIADQLSYTYRDFDEVFASVAAAQALMSPADCAPAAAVAKLLLIAGKLD